MRFRTFALALGLAALAGGAAAAVRAPAPHISPETLQRVTRTLSSDEFQGRAPGTVGEERTIAFMSQEFRRAGLQPGNHGSWFQDVPLVEITAAGNPSLHVTGGTGDLSFAYRTDYIGASYRALPHVSVDNSDIVFVGYGINAPERG